VPGGLSIMKKILKKVGIALLILVGLLGVALLVIFTTNVLVYRFDDREPAIAYQATKLKPAEQAPDTLVVMTYNVKFGGARIDFFFDCYGDRVVMTQEEVIKNMEGLASKINQVKPDILFLNEVDINGKRSADVDQMQWLLDNTHLNYGVYASQWQVKYVPSNGIGHINSGNGILSRWPLQDGERIALPQMGDQDPVTRFFYLRRNLLRATLDLPDGRKLALVCTHLDAYSKDDTRLKQLEILQQELADIKAKGLEVVFGGDLNTLAPGTKKYSNFDDSVCEDEDFVMDDYAKELTWLQPFYDAYQEVIPLAEYQADEKKYYSHTVNGKGWWNRRLDYLFTSLSWQAGSGLVHQNAERGGMETMPLSDHCPVSGVLVFRK